MRSLAYAAVLCSFAQGQALTRNATHAAQTPWEQAVQGRIALEALPPASRTRAQYTHAMDAFRAIYHDNPRDAHAAEAIDNVAELLVEQGHTLHDEKSLRAAVGQYEFLRTQYPASLLRSSALLAEGQIDENDLNDPAAARERYALLLKLYPKSESAELARAGLANLKSPKAKTVEVASENPAPIPVEKPAAVEKKSVPQGLKPLSPADDDGTAEAVPLTKPVTMNVVPKHGAAAAQVTGIRHWSTPTYTRVAIDLGDAVTFEAARVPHPDRIYFDLHGAKLAQELAGKSFAVTDDGFLKRICAAQGPNDVTRVVLDVNDVTEYSAFLLPNPYRLIIDIHGAGTGERPATAVASAKPDAAKPPAVLTESPAEVPVAPGAGRRASAAANTSGLPAMAPTDGGFSGQPAPAIAAEAPVIPQPLAPAPNKLAESVPGPRVGAESKATAARPVPNTVATPSANTDVAAVSKLPGRVEATSAPTSRPIATIVRKETKPEPPPVADAAPQPIAVLPTAPVATGKRGRKTLAEADAEPARAADKTADGEVSLVRALGLKIGRIVIDAGHGGHDSGTLGVDGIQEKDVVLDVALRLGKMLHERLGAEIIYTRSDDTFIPLETRTAIANKAQADLFLSIHANSSQDSSARGVETYYLNFTSSPDALEVAGRENAVGGQSIHQLSDLVKKITLKDKIAESREFAQDVEGSLYAGLEKGNDGLKNRGVKKAPFVVLIGANMPSILAEISFVTNPKDASQLRQPEYRQRVAESLFKGVAKYEGGLSGAKPKATERASVK
ncbi:N-acetylmuramoyl-L-alanine amidase [Granulicella rosea]|uniref:N-acetylmuramoyl-L-alanine amidase n=1 Tax=Granulicella rosea TaxID=474952 RepID=A0A239LK13_9BACT|nr:N-acetylmuramoyl-L-alanine amidase [Granulicella rosea]SNT30232.1 N-acetylmuramoyl-L-alanine amidase [Granulicella rosea]